MRLMNLVNYIFVHQDARYDLSFFHSICYLLSHLAYIDIYL